MVGKTDLLQKRKYVIVYGGGSFPSKERAEWVPIFFFHCLPGSLFPLSFIPALLLFSSSVCNPKGALIVEPLYRGIVGITKSKYIFGVRYDPYIKKYSSPHREGIFRQQLTLALTADWNAKRSGLAGWSPLICNQLSSNYAVCAIYLHWCCLRSSSEWNKTGQSLKSMPDRTEQRAMRACSSKLAQHSTAQPRQSKSFCPKKTDPSLPCVLLYQKRTYIQSLSATKREEEVVLILNSSFFELTYYLLPAA